MELIPVKSSNIKAVGYDKVLRILFVQFYSGGTYEYPEVPKLVYENFVSSESCGKFFHKYIKTVYTARILI